MKSRIYPWQQTQWDSWLVTLQSGRVPHALLFYGNPGGGIRDFCVHAGRSLLCENEDASLKPCGSCRACHLALVGTHPDCLLVEAEKNIIPIARVHVLIEFLQLERRYRQYRLAVIPRADRLNYSASNALLKILEEPPPWSVIMMGAENIAKLLPTIRSRCHKVRFPLPGEEAVEWLAGELQCGTEEARRKLKLHDMQALSALTSEREGGGYEAFHKDFVAFINNRQSPVAFVERWHSEPAATLQQWLLRECHDVLKAAGCGTPSDLPVGRITTDRLEHLYLLQIGRCRAVEVNLNPQLLLESSLMEWSRAFSKINNPPRQ